MKGRCQNAQDLLVFTEHIKRWYHYIIHLTVLLHSKERWYHYIIRLWYCYIAWSATSKRELSQSLDYFLVNLMTLYQL